MLTDVQVLFGPSK